ncbi:MAG: SRPBCC family protein [Solirubrobacteraceae bacterium]
MNGSLEQTAAGPRLRFLRELPHTPAVVWRALTDPERLRGWFPQRIRVERWEVGARIRFEHPSTKEATFDGQVLACEPPGLLEYTWGTDRLRFELEPHGEGTRLTMFDTIEQLGKAARDGTGWHVCLDLLEHELDGNEPGWDSSERWRELNRSYVAELGPEAASIGPPPGALE